MVFLLVIVVVAGVRVSIVAGEDALEAGRRCKRFLLRFCFGAGVGIEAAEDLSSKVVDEDGLEVTSGVSKAPCILKESIGKVVIYRGHGHQDVRQIADQPLAVDAHFWRWFCRFRIGIREDIGGVEIGCIQRQ